VKAPPQLDPETAAELRAFLSTGNG
jgi:hypothetical protein